MTDKNHEQYLEQIETAVAETTMDILEKHSGDLRAMAKLVAEKQVEINRLKEFYSEDKKIIRSLRVKLNEAVEESNLYQRDISRLVEDKKKLKDEIELQKDYIDAIPYKVEEYKDELHAVMGENRMLKDEIKELKKGDKRKLKKKVAELEERLDGAWSDYNTEAEMRQKAEKELEELQNEHEGICSKYHADFCELEEKREEVEKLKEENRRNDHQACAHLREILELKEKLKKV